MSTFDITSAFEDLAEGIDLAPVNEYTSPEITVGTLNIIDGTMPKWVKGQAADEAPAELVPVKLAIDMTNAKAIVTNFRLFEQLRGAAKGGVLPDGTPIARDFSEVTDRSAQMHLQAEFNIALVGAKILTEGEEGWTAHPLYAWAADPSKGRLHQIASRFTSRALEVYVRTPFMHIRHRDLFAEIETEILGRGFVPEAQRNARLSINAGPSRRNYIHRLQAPLPKGVVANPTRTTPNEVAARQANGWQISTFRLAGGRTPDQHLNGPGSEFVDFGYHLADNIRGALGLLAQGHNLSTSTSLISAITGIDRFSADRDTRPAGNSMRATISSLNWVPGVTDEAVKAAFTAKFGFAPAEVNDAMRAEVAVTAAAERMPVEFPFESRSGDTNGSQGES